MAGIASIAGALALAAALAAPVAAPAAPSDERAHPAPSAAGEPIPQRSCLWSDRLSSIGEPEENYAFPDQGAVYWTSKLSIPAGATLRLRGRYPYARYMSFNSYAADNTPTDAVNDLQIRPARGSRNPFLAGARRETGPARRRYVVRIVNRPAPERGSRRHNTLYAGVEGQEQQQLLYRVYVPDSRAGGDETGEVGLPRASLRLRGGRTLGQRRACRRLAVERGPLGVAKLSVAGYETLRHPGGEPPTFPASNPTLWRAFYDVGSFLACSYQDICGGRPVRVGGQYSNVDVAYVTGLGSTSFAAGPVWVLRGKLPTFPRTGEGVRRMRRAQLRYWSLCQNESSVTTRGADCIYDAQVPIDGRRRYTIVSSRPADRPANARRRCGVGFVRWPQRGDGAGNLGDGLLILRNLLPARGFDRAVQRTQIPGDEREVMGPYLPRGRYTTTEAFEARGC